MATLQQNPIAPLELQEASSSPDVPAWMWLELAKGGFLYSFGSFPGA
jgi:hypothetical protein